MILSAALSEVPEAACTTVEEAFTSLLLISLLPETISERRGKYLSTDGMLDSDPDASDPDSEATSRTTIN